MSDSVVYVVPDKMGGMLNIVAALVKYRTPDAVGYHAVLTDNLLGTDTRFDGALDVDTQQTVRYRLPTENLYAVIARVRAALPPGGGVLVSNDLVELAMLHVYDPGRMVVQLLHGDHDYYYDLAARHESVVDVWIAYSRAMYDGLRRRLPHRAADVHYLPYGVPLPLRPRTSRPGPLRLVFAGRIEDGQKGVFDLPRIDAALRAAGVDRAWTVIGDGPDAAALRARWADERITWTGALAHADVLARLSDFDVFVLPTRAEGLPVALAEAMGAGLVPVVSDIASGVPELVEPGRTGYRLPVGDAAAFAHAIAALASDRGRLEQMSRAAHDLAVSRFDPVSRAAAYQALFARWRELRRPWRPAPLPYRTRLDRPWLPNAVVRRVRGHLRRLEGKPA
jgi:glycosyltransferase involved in cell wall biosynthesis